jgi:hypothetical protein
VSTTCCSMMTYCRHQIIACNLWNTICQHHIISVNINYKIMVFITSVSSCSTCYLLCTQLMLLSLQDVNKRDIHHSVILLKAQNSLDSKGSPNTITNITDNFIYFTL